MENIFDKQRRVIYYELMQIGLEQQECWAEADLILEHVTGVKRTQQVISDLDNFKADWLHEITRIINSRRKRTPLAYCLGEVEFAGLMFRIVPGVLIPRVDTEAIVEAVINHLATDGTVVNDVGADVIRPLYSKGRFHRPQHAIRPLCPLHESIPTNEQIKTLASLYVAEIGVGCGAIIVSLLKRLPNYRAWGCDISELAIHTTLGNARRHNVHERLTLVHGDWKKVMPRDFNVIVSNPPYLPLALQKDMQPEISFEPKTALFDGSEDGLSFYRQFAEKLPAHFADRNDALMGRLHRPLQRDTFAPFAAFEIGDNQEQSILDIFKQSRWQDLSIIRDVNGLPRVLIASPLD